MTKKEDYTSNIIYDYYYPPDGNYCFRLTIFRFNDCLYKIHQKLDRIGCSYNITLSQWNNNGWACICDDYRVIENVKRIEYKDSNLHKYTEKNFIECIKFVEKIFNTGNTK